MTPLEKLQFLEADLDALEGRGARGYDAPSCDCVRHLLLRAEAMAGHAQTHLLRRIDDHLGRLTARFERDRARAVEKLQRLTAEGSIAPEALERSLDRGELDRIQRAARRVRRAEARGNSLARRTSRAELLAARRRSALRYEDSAAELVGTLAMARSRCEVPEGAGPYNVHRIAHRTLEALRQQSPLYLRAQLERLDELGSLMQLPAVESEAVPSPKRKGQGKRRRPARKRR